MLQHAMKSLQSVVGADNPCHLKAQY